MAKDDVKIDTEKTSTVEVDKSMLDALMKRLDDQATQINMLTNLAGKAAIKDFERASQDFTIKRAHLKMIGGKVVVSWGRLEQDVWKNEAGNWVENMLTTVKFADGTELQMRYLDFVREMGAKFYNIRATTTDAIDGSVLYTLEDENGATLVIKECYLNP